MYQAGCNAYVQSSVNTIEDNRVVLLKLYGGTLRFLANARRGINENSPKIRGENISKTLAIIEELECALDMEKGGKIAAQLSTLYKYVTDQLTIANVNNDAKALSHAERVLAILKEGFESAVAEQRAGVVMPPIEDESMIHRKGVSFAV